MTHWIIFVIVLLLAAWMLPPANTCAHEVRPGYLELSETSKDRFEVAWKLPLRGDLKPSLSPSFPPHCTQTSESKLEILPGSVIERWAIDCGPEGLEGHTIEILGLQYTLMDVALHIEMLDGRVYDTLIKGSKPRYTVEPGPGPLKITWLYLRWGMRQAAGRAEIWILLAAAALVLGGYGRILRAGLLLTGGYAASYVMGALGWMDMAVGWGTAAASILVLATVLRYRETRGSDEAAILPYAGYLVTGILLGAGFAGDWDTAGLASLDIPVALSSHLFGVWLGVLLLCSLLAVIRLILWEYAGRVSGWIAQVPGYVVGAAGAYLLYGSFSTLFTPGLVRPFIRPETLLTALAVGYIAGQRPRPQSGILLGTFLLALAGGMVTAISGIGVPIATTLIPVSLALVGIGIAVSVRLHISAVVMIALLSGVYLGWASGNWLTEHMGMVRSSAVGIVLLGGLLGYFTLKLRKRWLFTAHGIVDPAAGIGIVIIAVVMVLSKYRVSSFGEVSTLGTAGGMSIPLISLLMCAGVIGTLVVFFKRVQQRERRLRPALLASVFLILSLAMYPYGRVVLARPFVSQREMSVEQSRALVTDLLENTYRAINLQDEFEVYDKLSLSVHSSLMERLYLESRKRTVLPSQDNPEVQIIEVRVAEIIDTVRTDDKLGYAFTCEWYVSGTVRHWAHQHNRQNRYLGLITVKIEDRTWKIYGLELLDEKRIMDS
jgi:hydrogenase/urease accessory protein HupE